MLFFISCETKRESKEESKEALETNVVAQNLQQVKVDIKGIETQRSVVKEEKRPGRLYAEGILSFVKGCDTFTLGNSNDERTELRAVFR